MMMAAQLKPLTPAELAELIPWGNKRTAPPDEATRSRMRAGLQARIAEEKAKGYGKATFDKATKQLEKGLKQELTDWLKKSKHGPTEGQIRKAAKNGETLVATTPSDCFVNVEWTAISDDGEDGVCSLTFAHKTQGTWDIEMSLDEFLEFSHADSLGQAFNADWYGA
jgi:hypothetical protein